MRRKDLMLILIMLALGGIYVRFFTEWFRKTTFAINPIVRMTASKTATTYPMNFMLESSQKLTSIKVIPLSASATNISPLPVWHLVSKSGSPPISSIFYGMPVYGMRPAYPRIRPKPLDPDITYRMILTAGKATGQIDFKAKRIPGRD